MSKKDRRNYERRLIQKFALLKLANGLILEGLTRELSVGGGFIECNPGVDTVLIEGEECTIVLSLENEGLTTEIYGSISHTDPQGIGFNFLKINLAYYQFINEQSD